MSKDFEDDEIFKGAARLALFGRQKEIPGEGRSAVQEPEKHIRVKVTINLDGDIVKYFKEEGGKRSRSYQLLINEALREYVEGNKVEKIAVDVGKLLLTDPTFLQELTNLLKNR